MTDKDLTEEAMRGMQKEAFNVAAFIQPFIGNRLTENNQVRAVLRVLAKYIKYIDLITTSISIKLHMHEERENDALDSALSRLYKGLNIKEIRPSPLEVKTPSFNITLPLSSEYCLVSMWIHDHPQRAFVQNIPFAKSLDETNKLVKKGYNDLKLINENKYDRQRELKLMRIYALCCKVKKKLSRLPNLKVSLQDLLVTKPFPDRPFDKEYSEGFLRAARKNELKTINCLLTISRNLVFVYDWTYLTALHWAAKRGYTELMQILIDHGADVHMEDSLENTPLWYAMHLGHLDCIVLLIKYGAVLPKHTSLRKLENLGCNFLVRKIARTLIESKYCQYMISYSHHRQKMIHDETIKRVLLLAEENREPV